MCPNRNPAACSSCSRHGEHADWCPRRAIIYDPNPRLSDDEVRSLGYVHRDETGRWVHRRELAQFQRASDRRAQARRAAGERRCLTCGVDPHEREHMAWCDDAPPETVGGALRDARDLEAAIAWEPKVRPRRLTPPEREQLNKLFAALVRERRESS